MLLMKSLSLRRLACVPWLLAVGLVLGWAGEAVANTDATAGHATGDHSHVSDPKLVLTRDLHADGTVGSVHSITLNWSTSVSRNFGTAGRNRQHATTYVVRLFEGTRDEDEAEGATSDTPVGSPATYTGVDDGNTVNHVDRRTHTFTEEDIHYKGEDDDDNPSTDAHDGNYWAQISVTVIGDGNTTPVEHFFASITVQPDYVLSVNPSSVREDADKTDITVRARTGDGVPVKGDKYVILNLGSSEGFNTRYLISLPTLKIAGGGTETSGMISFTPIDDDVINDVMDPITIVGSAGSAEIVGSTEIELVDDDSPSTAINLSFSQASLSKRDGATEIVVTATLNGKTLSDDLRFSLTIDKDFSGSALRDQDYTAVMATLTIPDRKVSGKATITITPKNVGTGIIRVVASEHPTNDITVNGESIEITGDPSKELKGLTATPFSIREDAGATVVTLEVTLQNALLTDETVIFTISDDSQGLGEEFQGAVDARRDVDYAAVVQTLTIPKGQTTGTTTMTVTPVNNDDEDVARAFTVNARVGSEALLSTGILITDDDTTSDTISLSVSPSEINEDAGATTITVTGTLHGKEFPGNVVVPLIIDANPKNEDAQGNPTIDVTEATRDLDYTATLGSLVIPGESTEGTVTITITPISDNDDEEGDEIIRVKSSGTPTGTDEDGDPQPLEVGYADITLKDSDAEADADDGEERGNTGGSDETCLRRRRCACRPNVHGWHGD